MFGTPKYPEDIFFTVKRTSRDRIWDHALRKTLEGIELRPAHVARELELSERTARDCLRTMASYGWLSREGGEGTEPVRYHAGDELPKTLTNYR